MYQILNILLETNNKVLVEASPRDSICWGIGLSENDPAALDFRAWPGSNLLGFALMLVGNQLSFTSAVSVQK